jgi:hypothetical protein
MDLRASLEKKEMLRMKKSQGSTEENVSQNCQRFEQQKIFCYPNQDLLIPNLARST